MRFLMRSRADDRVLLDTHVLLWALAQPHRLDEETRATLESGASEVLFSAASIWEIAIKAGLGRADFVVKPAEIARAAVDIGFIELVIRSDAAALVAELPAYHRDPFDRVLVGQAHHSALAAGSTLRPDQAVAPARATQTAASSRTAPIGAASRRPAGRFFSAAMTAPNASIQPILADPITNISSIRHQQQPTQNAPCLMPKERPEISRRHRASAR